MAGHTKKAICLSECDELRGRRWVRRQEGEEEEVTREVVTHCHESLVTLEGLTLATSDANMGHAMCMVLKRLQGQVVVLVLFFS